MGGIGGEIRAEAETGRHSLRPTCNGAGTGPRMKSGIAFNAVEGCTVAIEKIICRPPGQQPSPAWLVPGRASDDIGEIAHNASGLISRKHHA